MAYCTAADVKTYRGISGSGDDTLITALIARAQALIDSYTGRTFEASADTQRYLTVGVDTDGRMAFLPDDLCQITSVVTDADGDADSLTVNVDYITEPRSRTPYFSLKLLPNSDYRWEYTTNPEMGVLITGRWAYSITPPADIAHACIRLASYFYAQKDAQVFDVTANPELGTITVPKGIPADVKKILDLYRRLV